MTPPHRCMGSASKSRAIKVVDSGMCGGPPHAKTEKLKVSAADRRERAARRVERAPGSPELIDFSPISVLKEFIAPAPRVQLEPQHNCWGPATAADNVRY